MDSKPRNNQNSRAAIPVLSLYSCPKCGHQTVQEEGATIMCNTCVNNFLAKHVGVMVEVLDDDGEE